MNYIQFYIYFHLLTITTTLLYPCQYIDSNEYVLKCDICKCLSMPSIYLTSNLCSLTSSLTCANNTNEEFQRTKLNDITPISLKYEKQIEFHNLNHDVVNYEELCSITNFSQMTFFNFVFNFTSNYIPKCLLKISSIRFINSFIENQSYMSDYLIFYNTTFNVAHLNLISTKVLIFHKVKFLIQPFELNSLMSLTHLTLTYAESFELTGSFPHLSYLNLDSTKLNDKKLNKIFSDIIIPDLATLILSNNQLTILTNKFPSTIRYLDLSKNRIKSLDYYSFKSLYSLSILNLSYNAPMELQQDTFTRIPYLEMLDLSHTMPTLPLDELFLPLQKLRHLNVSGNRLSTFPQLPIPYDAHSIESYEHHLPVLYVDLSSNNFDRIDFNTVLSSSIQDKYILSINMNYNNLKTLSVPAILLTDNKQRGPFIELDINNNPLECNCNLFNTILPLLKNDTLDQRPMPSNFLVLPPQNLQQRLPTGFDTYDSNYYIRSRRQNFLFNEAFETNSFTRQTRIKFLRASNLTCMDMIDTNYRRSLLTMNASNSFCSFTKFCPLTCPCCLSSFPKSGCHCYSFCPTECSCQYSVDRTSIYVNCSDRKLNRIPWNIPISTTHLLLNNNQIKSMEKTLTSLTKLKYLSLANNYLEHLSTSDFSSMIEIEHLDLSSNRIQNIDVKTFSTMVNLKKLYLHSNIWIPKFQESVQEFQSNVRLIVLTYANGLSCNRSTTLLSSGIEKSLSAKDCCNGSHTESCPFGVLNLNSRNKGNDINNTKLKRIFTFGFLQKYILISITAILFILACILTLCVYLRKHVFLFKEKYLSNRDVKKDMNRSHKKDSNPVSTYNQQENENSLSYTDEDEYASIPLTISQTDSGSSNNLPQKVVPPLPPPRNFNFNRPMSHSSTTSTSLTIRASKYPYSSPIKTIHSCLHIKLDVLVLYSINDCSYVHENIGQQLEQMYGRRFSFYFIHRDRMLGELDWLIENSCVVILILRKPYRLIHDYLKVLSICTTLKCFIILINDEENHRVTSMKIREKIARLYQTSDIYEWNPNVKSLIHEQLELFLEQHCGSSSYVAD